MRAAALIATIAGFVYVASDQSNLDSFAEDVFDRSVEFGKLWEQILMVIALALSAIMCIVGGLVGAKQVHDNATPSTNNILLLADGLVAVALGAASIATASLGTKNYIFLNQSLAALFAMLAYLFIMVVDAANGDSEESSGSSSKSNRSA